MVTKGRAVVDARRGDLRVKVAARLPAQGGVDEHPGERRSPHPFIAWIPLTGSLLLPLLIALLLFLLLGTAPSAVVEFFLIHLTLVIYGAHVWGGLVSLWPLVACRRRRDIRRRVYCWRDG